MTVAGTGVRFRRRTLLESVAQAFPRGQGFDRLRRRLRGTYERMLSSGGMTSVLPGGEAIEVAPEHRYITWNIEEYDAFRAAVRSGDTVIDAGANVGCYALLFGCWVGSSGHVYAFEPDPRAYEGLSRHVDLNGLRSIVTPINAAVSDGTRPDARMVVNGSPGVSRLAAMQPEAHTISVATTSIDEFCARHQITPRVIKIDVEGAELDVLRGARDTIARTHDLQLFVEMHPSLWRAAGIDADDLRRECAIQRLTVERLDGIGRDPWSVEGVALRLRRS
jgi:FkbM family methyltransferase